MNSKTVLQSIRDRLGYSNDEVAEYLGVSIHLVRKWENGTREFSPTVEKLIKVLGLVRDLAPGLHKSMVPKGRM
jgi:DNA-binding transcriptional regulator YiaG